MTIQNFVFGNAGRIEPRETSETAKIALAGHDPEIERLLEGLVQSRSQGRVRLSVAPHADPVRIDFDVRLGLPSLLHEVWACAGAVEDRFFAFYVPDEGDVPFTISIALARAAKGSREEKADRAALSLMAALAVHSSGETPTVGKVTKMVDTLWKRRPFVATTSIRHGLVGPEAPRTADAATRFHDVLGAAMVHRLRTGRSMWP